MRSSWLIPLLVTLAACASGGEEKRFPYVQMAVAPPARPAATPEAPEEGPPPPLEALPLGVDPAEIGQSVEGVGRLCEGSLERAKRLTDEIRALKGEPYTFWDYRDGAFHKGMGMRIDLIYANAAFAERVSDAYVDREARKGKGPSDHAPVVVDLDV